MCGCESFNMHFTMTRILTFTLRTLVVILFGLANIECGLLTNKQMNQNAVQTTNQKLILSNPPPPIINNSSSASGNSSSGSKSDINNIFLKNSSSYSHLQHSRQQLDINENHHNNNHLDDVTHRDNPDNNQNNNNNHYTSSTILDDNDDFYKTPMYFGTENSTTLTTQIGAIAHIPCMVHNRGEGEVSWIRRKGLHLLTVSVTTYSSDERFSIIHLTNPEDWTLQIKFVQLRDAGVYECQVSTHPPTSIFLNLNVVEARAEITGPSIRYLTPGSILRLQCRVVQNTKASEYIFWYHDNKMINYAIDRGINVSTEPDFQSSELTILKTRREHSGNYTCVASNTQPASVLVHIFKGDHPAAMYHEHVGSSTKSYQTQLHHFMLIISLGYSIFTVYVHRKIV